MTPKPIYTTVEADWRQREQPREAGECSLEELIEPLTRREHEILRLLAQGYTAPEIAGQLVLALSTVKSYVQQVYAKLAVHGRREAVARGRALGLLEAALPRIPAAWSVGGGGVGLWPGVSVVGAEMAPMRVGLEWLAAVVPAGYVLVLLMPTEMVGGEQ